MSDTDNRILAEVRAAVSALNDAAQTAAKHGYEVELSEIPAHSLETAVRLTIYSPRVTRVLV